MQKLYYKGFSLTRLSEFQSDLGLKHYLKYHKNLPKEKLEIGIRIKASFKSAIERQISEAVAIAREESKPTELMNSKAEYNRCKLPRLTAKSFEEQEKEIEATKEEEKEMKSEIRKMKLRNREEKEKEKNKQNERDDTLEIICREMKQISEPKWKKRRIEAEEERKILDKKDSDDFEKMKRLNKLKEKKKQLERKLRKEGKKEKESKAESWKELKKKMWRSYRFEDESLKEERETEKETDKLEREKRKISMMMKMI